MQSKMPVQIGSAFADGNIVVETIDGPIINLHQDLRDTTCDWFYWCFRIRSAAGETLRFNFIRSCAIGLRGPTISGDDGQTWNWLGETQWMEMPSVTLSRMTFRGPGSVLLCPISFQIGSLHGQFG